MQPDKTIMPIQEPVNFAGIPLRMLKDIKTDRELHLCLDYVTKDMESKQVKLVFEDNGTLREDEAAAMLNLLRKDSDVLAIKVSRFYYTKSTGQTVEGSIKSHPTIRVGSHEWCNVCPTTWERSNTYSVKSRYA